MAFDTQTVGVVSYSRSFGERATLNRGGDSPGTDSGRQATLGEPMPVSTLGRQNQGGMIAETKKNIGEAAMGWMGSQFVMAVREVF